MCISSVNVCNNINKDKPDTFDPVTVHVRQFTKLFNRMSRKEGIWEKLKVLGRSGRFELDACQDDDIHKPLRYNPVLSVRSQIYCSLSFVTILLDYLCFSTVFRQLPSLSSKVVSSLFLFGSLSSLGQFLSKRRWSKFSEMLRHSLLLGVLCSSRLTSSLWKGSTAHAVVEKCMQSNYSMPWTAFRAVLIAWSVGSLIHLYNQKDTEDAKN
ncbi:hypothetical protein RFI_14294 [Reticulomyxa filosa]|uniref:Uncharacterized protein n=1 Tax=Reticulomyxa filosa TaxID=46433 RepID=X6NA78_RETFI|nr:hypothetical protein RFI_14294 [Reticulomyxa filosa]|eukprot:ETO22901.1 hypothetical protein RFI_14294 [Reticulomyxa filosa]